MAHRLQPDTQLSPGKIFLGALLSLGLAASAAGDDGVDDFGLAFFEKRIRPVLIQHCYGCHSSAAKEVKGELQLDTRDALRRGGKSGKVVVPGDPEASLLIAALRYQDLSMPPAGKLADTVIADFAKWVEIGAPDPRDRDELVAAESAIDIKSGQKFWAFRPLKARRPPHSSGAPGSRSIIDLYIWAALEERELESNPPADNYTLLRRVYIDLVGLTPEPEEVLAFAAADSSDAYERVVDRLLASPHFGERWGRHWLDLVQYADSLDIERVFPNRGAWRYRDYVIRALNQNKGIDRFVTEQVAGDLLAYASDVQRAEQIVATQFLTLGPMNLVNQFKEQLRMDIVDTQVDKVGRVLVGITLSCARCHDHKFDPIVQTDYYALAGILQNVQVLNGFQGLSGVFSDWLRQPIPETAQERAWREERVVRHKIRVGELEAEIAENKQELARLEAEQRTLASSGNESSGSEPTVSQSEEELKKSIDKLKGAVTKLETDWNHLVKANAPGPPTVLAASEPAQPTNARITIRGNALQLGAEVPRGFPRALRTSAGPTIPADSSGRLELAQWLTQPGNPIVPRVFVNRVWQHLFGTGIVRTVNNFGKLGDRPSHPELLDYLAAGFVRRGWSIKELIREIVLSRTYRLSSAYHRETWSVDPDNRLLWRRSPRRLDGEAFRDTVLKISDSLSVVAGGPTLPPAEWLSGPISQFAQINDTEVVRDEVVRRRSIYLPVTRTNRKFKEREPLLPFDYPSPNEIIGTRQSSTVPTQSLFLMNSPFLQEQAEKLAARLLEIDVDADAVGRIFLAAYGRPGSSEEIQHGVDFVRSFAGGETEGDARSNPRRFAFVQLCHVMLMSTEFLTHD